MKGLLKGWHGGVKMKKTMHSIIFSKAYQTPENPFVSD